MRSRGRVADCTLPKGASYQDGGWKKTGKTVTEMQDRTTLPPHFLAFWILTS